MDEAPTEPLQRPAVRRLRALKRLLGATPRPIELQILGRVLLHAALVGAAAGLLGSLFFAGVEAMQRVGLESLTGYVPLRAAGEGILGEAATPAVFRPWLLLIAPACGALLAGILSTWLAPETRGGGSDAIIEAFHQHRGIVRKRVAFVKGLVSILTLGTGGSGGREGPTMQMGGAIGSLVGQVLRVTDRERRILLVAGTAAGMAAVFRTPLGAALLAVEVLHRDDFESEALVPAVLASVVSYSTFIAFFGERTLFAHAQTYPFVPEHLPLYALLAVLTSVVASLFLSTMRAIQRLTANLAVPAWCKPALGGLALGVVATPVIVLIGPRLGQPGQGMGILGGGYGAAQLAITGAQWFPLGWLGVGLLALLGGVKILATCLTVGSGGSAGDFGPSLVIGGLFGGAFGRAAQLLLHDPRIDPGAFALVGMGTFYGGLAHVPIASLVMTCELAGSYDLLVPLMFAEGIAFVALRNRTLYHAQVATKRDSPAHRDELILDVLTGIRVTDILVRNRPYATLTLRTPANEVVQKAAAMAWQDVFPVLDEGNKLVGIVLSDVLRTMAANPDIGPFTIAHDLMVPPVSVQDTDNLQRALEMILEHGLREIVVVDDAARIIGFLDEAEITRAYHSSTVSRSHHD
ncbi:MAG TPA: chloride channel protein [Polyangiaceae bacterium]|jgi:CIC family chloride channel protein|nr:chloride channel protein [Polyangiaceae bacterium]